MPFSHSEFTHFHLTNPELLKFFSKLKSFKVMSADLALSYATLILVDAKQDLSESNLEKLVTKVHQY